MRKQILAVVSCLMWACASPSASSSDRADVVAGTQSLTEGCPRGIDINRATQDFLLGHADELGIVYCQLSNVDYDNYSQCEPDGDVVYICYAGHGGATDYKADASSLSCRATDSGGVRNESSVTARDHVDQDEDTDPSAGWYDYATVYCECDEQGAHCGWG
jgi:hypothetical protein